MSLPFSQPSSPVPLTPLTQASTSPSARFATLSLHDALAQLRTNLDTGLSSQDAAYRRNEHGLNELVTDDAETMWSKLVEQFKNPLILLLFASAGVSLLLGEIDDAISIALAIIIVVTVAFVQEYRSEQSLEALNKLVPHYCHVTRDGVLATLLAAELVPGDVVRFSTGDRIPADVRLATSHDLHLDESSLTGETEPCGKHHDAIEGRSQDLPLAERNNIAFMGTLVRCGHGSGIVVGTGKHTEFGHVFYMMKEVEVRKTPLQLKMDHLGKQLSLGSFIIIGFITLIGILQGRHWLEMFTIGVSLAVAAIPEGLPIVVTVTLALGVLRMADRHAIVKKLPSVEALGSVTVICADKTGTLTMNKMTVKKIYTLAQQRVVDLDDPTDPENLRLPASTMLMRIGNLCNNAHVDESGHTVGQPTEIAFLELRNRLGLPDERSHHTKVSEQPFSSDRKWMSVEYRTRAPSNPPSPRLPRVATLSRASTPTPSPSLSYVKGAPEPVLERCKRYYVGQGDERPMDPSARATVDRVSREIANEGLRILALAYGPNTADLTFVGFVGMYDPPRPGVQDAIATLRRGGVRMMMITGDSEGTASSIAQQLGIPVIRGSNRDVMSGPALDSLSERELQEHIAGVSVFYRATPRNKMTIIKALQARGDIVAMTGDGVNDAPALRLSDIGISMGKSGTDVAKEAADMILVNDDFSTVLYAIEEGKSIFYNIQNFLRFQLSTSLAALSLIAIATFLKMPNPLNAMQILWINIICDGPVAQSLGVEPVDPEIMKRPPRAANEPIITKPFIMRVLGSASTVVLGTIVTYAREIGKHADSWEPGSPDAKRGTTMTFTVFVLFSLFNAQTCRSQTRSIITSVGLFTNRMLNYATAACVIFQIAVVHWTPLQTIFQTADLEIADWMFMAFVGFGVVLIDEAAKWVIAGRFGRGLLLRGAPGGGFSRVRGWAALQSGEPLLGKLEDSV
ncbi:High affinity Ca2+/Mn2+ P-type ATPase-like protein [Geranomyces michiganensis]|nr:High affinity Ca2+/Mn2+ P-type ATPase-like protein [Geranomyces michiganensis]